MSKFRKIKEDIINYSRLDMPVKFTASMEHFRNHLHELNKNPRAVIKEMTPEEGDFYREYAWWFYKILAEEDKKKWWEFWK